MKRLLNPALKMSMSRLARSLHSSPRIVRVMLLWAACAAIAILGVSSPSAQQRPDAPFVPGELLVRFRPVATEGRRDGLRRAVAEEIPLFGFYLQPSVGGRLVSYDFWRGFCEIPEVAAIKVAPFNRYQTLDVVRAVIDSGRASDIALYTGNDDNIVLDFLTPYVFQVNGRTREYPIVGGLLGHWAVWTLRAVDLLQECHAVVSGTGSVPKNLLQRSAEITDTNAAFFDVAHHFAGCIAGLHEVLRRQGLLEGIWCLDQLETLSPGQQEEIDRVYAAYPHLNDDAFVLEGRDQWLKP